MLHILSHDLVAADLLAAAKASDTALFVAVIGLIFIYGRDRHVDRTGRAPATAIEQRHR